MNHRSPPHITFNWKQPLQRTRMNDLLTPTKPGDTAAWAGQRQQGAAFPEESQTNKPRRHTACAVSSVWPQRCSDSGRLHTPCRLMSSWSATGHGVDLINFGATWSLLRAGWTRKRQTEASQPQSIRESVSACKNKTWSASFLLVVYLTQNGETVIPKPVSQRDVGSGSF